MTTAARSCGVAGLVTSLAAAAALSASPVSGQTTPLLVTTDTPQYCLHLLDEVSQLMRDAPSPPPEVTNLSTEGQRMCGQGQTRGGILRLRRALVLLKSRTLPP
jgi:hypothetical protein